MVKSKVTKVASEVEKSEEEPKSVAVVESEAVDAAEPDAKPVEAVDAEKQEKGEEEGGGEGEGEEEEGEEEEEYTIEKILKRRVRKGEEQFLIKWLGWDEEGDNTWEPLAHIEDTVQYEEWLKSQEKPAKGAKTKMGADETADTPKKRRSPASKEKKSEDEEKADAPSKSPRKRKKKNPELPKKAATGYIFFAAEHRQGIMQANPNYKMIDVGKELGERWRKMSDEEKAPYMAKQKADKERYDAEMAAYKTANGGAAPAEAGAKDRESEPEAAAEDATPEEKESEVKAVENGETQVVSEPTVPSEPAPVEAAA